MKTLDKKLHATIAVQFRAGNQIETLAKRYETTTQAIEEALRAELLASERIENQRRSYDGGDGDCG